MDRGDHDRSAELLAVVEDDAFGLPIADEDVLNPGLGSHRGSKLLGRAAAGVRNSAHAAFREPPAAEMTVADVADRVVRHHIRGAGAVRPSPGADDAVDGKARLDLLRLEPVAEEVGDAHGHEPGQVADLARAEASELPAELRLRDEVCWLHRSELRRDCHEQRPHDLGQVPEPGVP